MYSKVLLISIFLFGSLILSAQHSSNYNFLGKVTIKGKKAKGVLIKAFDEDTCFSSYSTSSNGKFVFSGEADKYFIIQFEKPGYVTKQLIVNTNNIKHGVDEIKKYKFNIYLSKLKKGSKNNEEDIVKADVIEINRTGLEFTYKSRRDKHTYLYKDQQMASK